MSSLNEVLKRYAPAVNASLGKKRDIQTSGQNVSPVIDRDRLRRDLEKVKKDNGRYFLVCVILVVILFIASLTVVLANLHRQDIVTTAITAFGASTAGVIWLMVRLWREKSNSELLLALAVNMGEAELNTVIEILAARLKKLA